VCYENPAKFPALCGCGDGDSHVGSRERMLGGITEADEVKPLVRAGKGEPSFFAVIRANVTGKHGWDRTHSFATDDVPRFGWTLQE